MPTSYIPVLLVAFLAIAIPVVGFAVWKRVSPDSLPAGDHLQPGEKGTQPEPSLDAEHSERMFAAAILSIIFAASIVLLFLLVAKFSQMGGYGLAILVIFMAMVLAGYVWLCKTGALDWN